MNVSQMTTQTIATTTTTTMRQTVFAFSLSYSHNFSFPHTRNLSTQFESCVWHERQKVMRFMSTFGFVAVVVGHAQSVECLNIFIRLSVKVGKSVNRFMLFLHTLTHTHTHQSISVVVVHQSSAR